MSTPNVEKFPVPVYIAKGKDDTYLFSAVLDKDQLEELRNMSIKARKRKEPKHGLSGKYYSMMASIESAIDEALSE
jgi:hypothetical protein